ncbi:MAG: hypothetical protein PHX87_04290 [Candidatus Peribacteraceae bacterium]|nr:hypothetical protein [Candidatus Peribacteraceae bacterium]MDD5742618.1 hypothetical protein [Candidatus Peribacteraceae bacterium]
MTHFLSVLIGLIAEPALAADPGVWGMYCNTFGACGGGQTFLLDLAGRTATFIFQLVGGGAVLAVLYGSVKLIFGGEAAKDEAKKIIEYALGGLVLAIMGWSIIYYVEGLLVSVTGG